jgi:hypothetical protein
MNSIVNEGKRTEAGYEVLTAAVMNAAIFWDIAQCSP